MVDFSINRINDNAHTFLLTRRLIIDQIISRARQKGGQVTSVSDFVNSQVKERVKLTSVRKHCPLNEGEGRTVLANFYQKCIVL